VVLGGDLNSGKQVERVCRTKYLAGLPDPNSFKKESKKIAQNMSMTQPKPTYLVSEIGWAVRKIYLYH
jgi:hypothetical protein